MAHDGRLTIRFNELLKDIEAVAKRAKRDTAEWVRMVIAREVARRLKTKKRGA